MLKNVYDAQSVYKHQATPQATCDHSGRLYLKVMIERNLNNKRGHNLSLICTEPCV